MKKTIIWIIFALVCGGLLGRITFNFYEKLGTQNVISYDKYVYLLMYGKYNSFDDMKNNVTDLDRYIFIKKDNIYYVYLAISKTKDNMNKIKKIYDNKNIKCKIVREIIDNEEFIQNLNEYEKLLTATEDDNSILIIEKQILSCYESVVVAGE